MQELPGLYTACREVIAALQQAYERVDTGHFEDHPKLAALRAVLTTVSAIQPVSFHLTACSFGDTYTEGHATTDAMTEAIQSACTSCPSKCWLLTSTKYVRIRFGAFVQGGKVLLVADSGAFFTVYRTIAGTGLRAYQLDRDSQHKPAVPDQEVRTPVTSAVYSPQRTTSCTCRVCRG